MSLKYFRFEVTGVVQGVNFRAWTKKMANGQNVTGWIRNHSAGHVEGEALGELQNMDNFKALLHQGPRYAKVSEVKIFDEKVVGSADEIGWRLGAFEVRYREHS